MRSVVCLIYTDTLKITLDLLILIFYNYRQLVIFCIQNNDVEVYNIYLIGKHTTNLI